MKKIKYLLFTPTIPFIFQGIIFIINSCNLLDRATISGIVLTFIMGYLPVGLILEAIGFVGGILYKSKLYTLLFALEFLLILATYIILIVSWH